MSDRPSPIVVVLHGVGSFDQEATLHALKSGAAAYFETDYDFAVCNWFALTGNQLQNVERTCAILARLPYFGTAKYDRPAARLLKLPRIVDNLLYTLARIATAFLYTIARVLHTYIYTSFTYLQSGMPFVSAFGFALALQFWASQMLPLDLSSLLTLALGCLLLPTVVTLFFSTVMLSWFAGVNVLYRSPALRRSTIGQALLTPFRSVSLIMLHALTAGLAPTRTNSRAHLLMGCFLTMAIAWLCTRQPSLWPVLLISPALPLGVFINDAVRRLIYTHYIKPLADVVLWLGDIEYRDQIRTLLDGIIEAATRKCGRPLVFLAHSLGTVIAADWVVRHASGPTRSVTAVGMVSFGSPLRALIARYFPEIGKDAESVHSSLYRKFGAESFWINVYRPLDYIGRCLHLDTRLRGRDLSTGQWTRNHTDYWSDPKVWQCVKSALEDLPVQRGEHQAALGQAVSEGEIGLSIPLIERSGLGRKVYSALLATLLFFSIFVAVLGPYSLFANRTMSIIADAQASKAEWQLFCLYAESDGNSSVAPCFGSLGIVFMYSDRPMSTTLFLFSSQFIFSQSPPDERGRYSGSHSLIYVTRADRQTDALNDLLGRSWKLFPVILWIGCPPALLLVAVAWGAWGAIGFLAVSRRGWRLVLPPLSCSLSVPVP